jgi:glycolate dehydrogenase FAD-binding subunit
VVEPVPSAPANEADLVAIVRAASEAKLGIVTEGSGTKRHLGPSAAQGARRVSLRALDRIISYEPGDMVVCVQTGTRWVDLQRELASRNQWLPVDPPYAEATIGGVLATHSSGPRRLAYGTIKDLLLGARVVGASGQATKSGGRVVKNVSGYDLHKLHVGAFGSLGVIVEANFRVSTRPEAAAVMWLAFPTLADSHQFLLDVAATSLRPCALEALDPLSAGAVAREVSELPRERALALIGIEGSRPVLDRHVRDLAVFRGRAAASGVLEGPPVDDLWGALRDLPAGHESDVTVRVGARPHRLLPLLAGLQSLEGRHTGTVVQAALGLARISVEAPSDLTGLAVAISKWQAVAKAYEGYAVVESAPIGRSARASLPWSVPTEHGLGRLIKRRWDPDEILNPGRVSC